MATRWRCLLVIVQYLDRTDSFINFKNQNHLILPPSRRGEMIDSVGDRGYNNKGLTQRGTIKLILGLE